MQEYTTMVEYPSGATQAVIVKATTALEAKDRVLKIAKRVIWIQPEK